MFYSFMQGDTNKVKISLLKISEALDLYFLGFTIIDKVLFIIISSIFTHWRTPNSNSFAIAETDTNAAPKPD